MLQPPVVFLIFIFAGLLLYSIHTKLHRLKNRIGLDKSHHARLLELAELSLCSSDVPVGALLIYNGEIIGEGYNTVLRHRKAGEHAEVNAISSAIEHLGMETFSALDRRHLILVSTFEPCLMCAGAFVNYNIQYVYFMKEKDLAFTAREEALLIRYLFRRKQIKNNNEQESLFERHPGYKPKGK
ncbi:MAG TPA: nucleoside deaminase [Bacteroidota bacterium]|nr:nucleoside deaminase [Bacteroidota bacterium]